MPFIYILPGFLLLSLLRYTFLPAWPINFIPIAYLLWHIHKPIIIWQLLLLGLTNDVFAVTLPFGLTALAFTFLALLASLVDHWGKRTFISFATIGLLLCLANGPSLPSLLSFPLLLIAQFFHQSETSLRVNRP